MDDDARRAFRRVVGSFATGVCVVTTAHEESPAGMTLNSFTSVSLDPMLVLICLAQDTRSLNAVRSAGGFAISILRRGQQQVALDFAARGGDFPHHHVHRTRHGFYSVTGALADLHCEVHDILPAGDHDIVLGRVVEFVATDGEPLVFHAGQFGGVDPDQRVPRPLLDFLDEGSGW